MLEIYCLLHYNATDNLKNGILNNWLVNVKGQPGSWIKRDLLQEHYNKWLKDLIGVHGGSFNDDLYRKTVAPNIKGVMEIKNPIGGRIRKFSRLQTPPPALYRSNVTSGDVIRLDLIFKLQPVRHFFPHN